MGVDRSRWCRSEVYIGQMRLVLDGVVAVLARGWLGLLQACS
jgi:hypothetical protein